MRQPVWNFHFFPFSVDWFGFGEVRSRALRDGMADFEGVVESAIVQLAQPIPA